MDRDNLAEKIQFLTSQRYQIFKQLDMILNKMSDLDDKISDLEDKQGN